MASSSDEKKKLSPMRPIPLKNRSRTTDGNFPKGHSSMTSGHAFSNIPQPISASINIPTNITTNTDGPNAHFLLPQDKFTTHHRSLTTAPSGPSTAANMQPITSNINPFDDPTIVGELVQMNIHNNSTVSSGAPPPLSNSAVGRSMSSGSGGNYAISSSPQSSFVHPLLSSSNDIPKSPAIKQQQQHQQAKSHQLPPTGRHSRNPSEQNSNVPTHHRGNSSLSFDPLLNSNINNLNSSSPPFSPGRSAFNNSPLNMSTNQNTASIQLPPHKLELSSNQQIDLAYIAQELSAFKPRKNTPEEEEEIVQENHRITLGNIPKESTGTRKSHIHRRVNSNDTGGVGAANHRKLPSGGGIASSVRNVFGVGNIKNNSNTSSRNVTPVRSRDASASGSRSTTPKRVGKSNKISSGSPRKSGVISDSKIDGKQSKSVNTSITDQSKAATEAHFPPTPQDPPNSLSIPNTPTPKPIEIRSSEQDPSVHQIAIPPAADFLLQARLCELLDCYRKVDQNFDFSSLVSMSRLHMERFVHGPSTLANPSSMNAGSGSAAVLKGSLSRSNTTGSGGSRCSTPTQDPIVGLAPSTFAHSFTATGSGIVTPPVPTTGAAASSSGGGGGSGTGGIVVMQNPPSPGRQIMSAMPTLPAASKDSIPNSSMNTMNMGGYMQKPQKPQQAMLMETHKPILSSVLECGDDIVVEAFYHEEVDEMTSTSYDTTKEKPTTDRMEVAIFQSDKSRQFIVVYQGSADAQMKPVRNREQKASLNARFSASTAPAYRFSKEQPVAVFPSFRKAYFPKCDLEGKVFHKLDELSETYPFFDVIMTGHSFGGVLATLASMRYAFSRPQIMVSCLVFGSPKIGDISFRHLVNSLPNLKVMRLEYGSDPWVHSPENACWIHCGHAIVINPNSGKSLVKTGKNSGESTSPSDQEKGPNALINAYKFGINRPGVGGGVKFIGKLGSRRNLKQDKQHNHEIGTYVHAMEQIAKLSLPWPNHFIGEAGEVVPVV